MKRYLLFTLLCLSCLFSCKPDNDAEKDKEKQKEASITVKPTAIIMDATQTEASFQLTTSDAWTISFDADWISAVFPTSGSSAAEEQAITLTVEENPADLRSAMLHITCGDLTKDVMVSQAEAAGKEILGKAYLMKATLLEDAKGFNMLSDPDFEDSGNQALNAWNPWWAVYSVRVEGGAQSGDYYCKLNSDVLDENLSFQTVCTQPNVEYSASAWFLSNLPSGSPDTYFGLRVGVGTRPVNFEVRLGDGFTTSWTQYTKTCNVGNNPVSEVFAFQFHKEGYYTSWDNVCLKRPGDTQRSFGLTNMTKVADLYELSDGVITTGDGCTAWEDADGKICLAFGRNVGEGEFSTRENAFATSGDGLASIDVLKKDGKVAVILPPGSKEGGVLPTAGVTVGNRRWIHYQVIRDKEFGANLWRAWSGGLAYSDDGNTWTRSDVVFDKSGNFMEVCFYKEDGYVYMFGSHIARDNGENTPVADEHYVKVARCPEADMDKAASWKYWNGADWVAGESSAVPIIYTGTLGELSVMKSAVTGRYMMIYSSIKRNAVVVRDAQNLTGDWSGEHILYPLKENEMLYAPSFVPSAASGNDLYFIVSSLQ